METELGIFVDWSCEYIGNVEEEVVIGIMLDEGIPKLMELSELIAETNGEWEVDISEERLLVAVVGKEYPCWEKLDCMDWTLEMMGEYTSLEIVEDITSMLETRLDCCEVNVEIGLGDI